MLHIFWFRKDLRITDNKALSVFLSGLSQEDQYAFLYIKNRNTFNFFGEKRVCFLLESLRDLEAELAKHSFKLQITEGSSEDIFRKIIKEVSRISLFVNEQVEPYCIGRDKIVRELIEKNGGIFNSFSDTTIFKIGEINSSDGKQYKVFTPFKNQALKVLGEQHYMKVDCDFQHVNRKNEKVLKIILEYDLSKEHKKITGSTLLKGGRTEGLKLLKKFYESGIEEYKSNRDLPSVIGTSLLSAHLHFGTINVREAFRTAFIKLDKVKTYNKKLEVQTWINELLWREFYYNITYYFPEIIFDSFQKQYDKLKWSYNRDLFRKWCDGMTGYPIVDAGMRQLNQEGWMHNRVRMIVAMFLTKDLFIDWRWGEKYFAEKLIDLDFSNNNGGWQWSASTGVDAQPYFRIFNPYLQSKKFDADGVYIKKYVPELINVPSKLIHEPHLMTIEEQTLFKVEIGKNYPEPVVDHKKAREAAIKEFKRVS